jgi:hypothetical protein
LSLSATNLANVAAYVQQIGAQETGAVDGKGTGTGLVGQYFNNITLSGAPVATVNQAGDFDWTTAALRAGVNANVFSVRWSGMLEPQATGTYKFQTVSDDGVRLWVNGVQLTDDWTLHSAQDNDHGRHQPRGRPALYHQDGVLRKPGQRGCSPALADTG